MVDFVFCAGRLGHALLIRFAHKYARPRLAVLEDSHMSPPFEPLPHHAQAWCFPTTHFVRVPGERLELSHLAAMGFESIASTNSAIPAYAVPPCTVPFRNYFFIMLKCTP